MMLYPMIWSDPCSDVFFACFELSVGWIAVQQALESASYVALGYLDFQVKHHKDESLQYVMRRKRLAFAKFSFMASISTLMMLDPVSKNCILPLLVGSMWTAMKMGTQVGYKLTPDKFFHPRIFIAVYNILFLLAIWVKLRRAKEDKRQLEFDFFQRVEGIMLNSSLLT